MDEPTQDADVSSSLTCQDFLLDITEEGEFG